MQRLGPIFGILFTFFTFSAQAGTATCQDSGYNESKFKGQIYLAFKNTRTPLEMWYATEMRNGKPHYQRVDSFQATPENKYIRGGFEYTAVLPLNGKEMQVTVSGNTSGSMITIHNEDGSYDLTCE